MRIDPRFAASAITPSIRSGQASGTKFKLDEGGKAHAAATHGAASLATLDAILQLQSEEDPAERRRRSARRGHDLLDGLDRLKAALLAGSVPAAELSRIARSLADAGSSGDPQLDGIVAQIELRARVELAKLGRAEFT